MIKYNFDAFDNINQTLTIKIDKLHATEFICIY